MGYYVSKMSVAGAVKRDPVGLKKNDVMAEWLT
jgi:hypothetical protein